MATTRSRGTLAGTTTVVGTGTTTKTVEIGSDSLVTTVNGYPAIHPFDKTGWQVTGYTTGGTVKSNTTADYIYEQYPCSGFGPLAPPELPTGATGAQLFAATNPTRAAVKLPVALFELRELPALYHQALSLLTKRRDSRFIRLLSEKGVADANLLVRFGLMPVFSDVKNLFLMPDSIKKRAREWERLASGKGLKRRVKLGSAKMTVSPGGVTIGGLYSSRFGVQYPEGERRSESWGVATWKPSGNSPYASLPPSIPEIRGMLLGLKTFQQVSNLWDALPWTWLIDYFSSVGDVLEANQGRHLVTPSGGCIMTTTIETHTMKSKTVNSIGYPADRRTVSFLGGQKVGHRYTRRIASASVQAYMPTLSNGQLSILGSLLVSRFGRTS